MKKIETSALIGLGAIGILYGKPMQENLPAGSFHVIADEARIARYEATPVTCNGETCTFTYATPEQGSPVDFILVAVKATAMEQTVKDIAKWVGPDTVIVSILNGITSEETLEAAYPGHCLWSVAIGMDATRDGRTLVYQCPGRIQLGERDGSSSERLAAVSAYLTGCGVPNEPCNDILYKQWYKLAINVGLNQTTAAYGLTYGGLAASKEALQTMTDAMLETIALAHAEGIPLPDDIPYKWIENNLPTQLPEGMPSMQQDILGKRKTEVAEFAGVVCSRSKKYGLATPVNDWLYERIRALEAAY